jgi:multidrug resistance efflux pump
MSKSFKGEVKARIIDARFAVSGKISNVSKHTGDIVKKGNLIASLDRKILQMELDQQLSQHEKVRADWDGFTQKYPDPQDDNKYTKAEKQASLNASVKDVELAKARLDQADLFSPVDGIIIDDSDITSGQNVTPAGSSVKIVDMASYCFEFEVEQKEVANFNEARRCKINIEGIKETFEGDSLPVFSDGKRFVVKVMIPSTQGLLLGMKGSASI